VNANRRALHLETVLQRLESVASLKLIPVVQLYQEIAPTLKVHRFRLITQRLGLVHIPYRDVKMIFARFDLTLHLFHYNNRYQEPQQQLQIVPTQS